MERTTPAHSRVRDPDWAPAGSEFVLEALVLEVRKVGEALLVDGVRRQVQLAAPAVLVPHDTAQQRAEEDASAVDAGDGLDGRDVPRNLVGEEQEGPDDVAGEA